MKFMSKSNMSKVIKAAQELDPKAKVIALDEFLKGGTDDSKEFAECGVSGGISFSFKDGEILQLVPQSEQTIMGHYFTMRNGKIGRTVSTFFQTARDKDPIEIPLSMFRRTPDCKEEQEDILQNNDAAKLLHRMFDSVRIKLLYEIFGTEKFRVVECKMHHNYYTNDGKFVRDSADLPAEERRDWTCYKFVKVQE